MRRESCLICLLFCISTLTVFADSTWKNTFALGQSEEWYGSNEAIRIAENVLLYQKNSGGWPKNEEMHEELTESQKTYINSKKNELSCFDNGATTTEMRFLAKVYKHVSDVRYREAFNRGLNCLIEAQSVCGNGWPQYWPERGGGAGTLYSDFITFNDNTVVNILNMLQDVIKNTDDFADITDEATRQKAQESFDKGLQCIFDCQIRNDEGELTVWCAQHHPATLLPAVGRNYEVPSYSGSESAKILLFLMSFEKPSDAMIQAIEGGVNWFKNHTIADKALEKFVNEEGEEDFRIVDSMGNHLWGRFVQIGGEIGKRTYDAFFEFLEQHGSTRTIEYNGNYYSYHDADNARNSYNPNMAEQPIFCPKTSEEGCSYRFAYNFNDTEPVPDSNGVLMRTSLNSYDRTTYSFLGTWGEKVLSKYENWKLIHDKQCSTYAIAREESFIAGTTIKFDHITLTYGVAGDPDFNVLEGNFDDTFGYYTPGNSVNGSATNGTFYTFRPVCDGMVTAYIKHNLVKPLYVIEDGVALPEYNGVTFDDTHPITYGMTFAVRAGSEYKLYCTGSKLGFFGFDFCYEESQGINRTINKKCVETIGIYSVDGQELAAPRKGLNIINGKKVYIR